MFEVYAELLHVRLFPYCRFTDYYCFSIAVLLRYIFLLEINEELLHLKLFSVLSLTVIINQIGKHVLSVTKHLSIGKEPHPRTAPARPPLPPTNRVTCYKS